MKEFSVAKVSIIATGKERISTSGLWSFLLTMAYKIASSTLSLALSRIFDSSGEVKSSILISNFLTHSAVSLRKGYFARSFLVNFAVNVCILVFHVILFRFLALDKM